MAKYYHSEVARWEGEGGALDEGAAFWNVTQLADPRDRKIGASAMWQIVSGIVILAGSLVYARQKGWI
ncbi:MAG: hypothetical protein ACRD7E_10905 [Bryobacteraceae bacterium]